jgi:N-methylhydantoinase A
MENVCIGVDVGGTFTDAVLAVGTTMWRAKALTTPHDLGQGVIAACEGAAARAHSDLDEILPNVRRFGLGTTAVTNVLAAHTGRRVGLITTRGFEDLVPLALGRWEWSDGWLVEPRQIVAPDCIAGVAERVDRDGQILESLDGDALIAAARHLVEGKQVEALTVSFLWSFRNPANEEMAGKLIERAFPDVPVVLGSALLPLLREYERTTYALLNAYTMGTLKGIDSLQAELRQRGLSVPLLLVHSGGGSISVEQAHKSPLLLAESGPAAGVSAAAAAAVAHGAPDAVTLDMGGTTLDLAIVAGGEPSRRTRGDVMGVWTALSSVDVESVGAGGGSVAWVDSLGALRVGPRSAGAVPGPACYGRGGVQPTVTDALLVLGYLDPEHFLGGELSLDREAARQACASVGASVGLDAHQLAWGIREITLAGMATAVRSRLAERGLDPAEQAIISYGGCGGMFAVAIAQDLGCRAVVIPEVASVLSALGAATLDVRRERSLSVGAELDDTWPKMPELSQRLQAEVQQDLLNDGVDPSDCNVTFEVDLRIRRQKWELAIPLPATAADREDLARLEADFRAEYVKRYGEGAFLTGPPIEVVALRAIGVGRTFKIAVDRGREEAAYVGDVPVQRSRDVAVRRDAPPETLPAVEWSDLRPGHRLAGPAILDSVDTTVWIPPGTVAHVDPQRNVVVTLGRSS